MKQRSAEEKVVTEAAIVEEGISTEKDSAAQCDNEGSEASTPSTQDSSQDRTRLSAEDSNGSTNSAQEKSRSDTEDSGGSAGGIPPLLPSLGEENSSSMKAQPPSTAGEDQHGNSLELVGVVAAATPEDVQADVGTSPELQKILDEDAVQFPTWAWCMLAPMTIYTVAYAYVKKNVLSTCSPVGYWLWYFSPVPVLYLFMYV